MPRNARNVAATINRMFADHYGITADERAGRCPVADVATAAEVAEGVYAVRVTAPRTGRTGEMRFDTAHRGVWSLRMDGATNDLTAGNPARLLWSADV